MGPTLLWFRNNLRLQDNPALGAALQRGQAILPVYIFSEAEAGKWPMGGAASWWLHQSLQNLAKDLTAKGSRLLIYRGPALPTLQRLIRDTKAEAVYWDRRYEPSIRKRDEKIESTLKKWGLAVQTFNTSLLWEPWEIENHQGAPYQVFTPFYKKALELGFAQDIIPVPKKIPAPAKKISALPLAELKLEPKIDWAKGIRRTWTPGEAGAQQAHKEFIKKALPTYIKNRDRPDLQGTSRLSPYLHFGEIGPKQIWKQIQQAAQNTTSKNFKNAAQQYLRQICWREFAYHLLYHFPKTPDLPLRENFSKFPWKKSKTDLRTWQRGKTGYPIVDAGMRELWQTGWMHNRVRMIVASFLTKDLLQPWQSGATWFWDTLVDADLANNTLGWQWTAGCGADAAPYFRIFNPITQGERFDPQGEYVRQYIPELNDLPNSWIHRPWEAPAEVLKKAGIRLGKDYPKPIVDHSQARDLALAAYEKIKKL